MTTNVNRRSALKAVVASAIGLLMPWRSSSAVAAEPAAATAVAPAESFIMDSPISSHSSKDGSILIGLTNGVYVRGNRFDGGMHVNHDVMKGTSFEFHVDDLKVGDSFTIYRLKN